MLPQKRRLSIEAYEARIVIARTWVTIMRRFCRDYFPDLPLGKSMALGIVAVHVFLATVEGRTPSASALARVLGMSRVTLLRRLRTLERYGYVKRVGYGYKAVPQHRLPGASLRQHVHHIIDAAKELSKMNGVT